MKLFYVILNVKVEGLMDTLWKKKTHTHFHGQILQNRLQSPPDLGRSTWLPDKQQNQEWWKEGGEKEERRGLDEGWGSLGRRGGVF